MGVRMLQGVKLALEEMSVMRQKRALCFFTDLLKAEAVRVTATSVPLMQVFLIM